MSIPPINTLGPDLPAARAAIRTSPLSPAASASASSGTEPQDRAKVSAEARRMSAGMTDAQYKLHLSPRELRELISPPERQGVLASASETEQGATRP